MNELTVPPTEETGRMKRLKTKYDPREAREIPQFLRAHSGASGADAGGKPPKSLAFQPAWGFRKTDSVLGSTQHSADWSLHSITPVDYKDVVLDADMEGIESLGSQSLASVRFSFSF